MVKKIPPFFSCLLLFQIFLVPSAFPSSLKEGKIAYMKYCSGCHGVNGDGNGPASKFLNPKPRDFTKGIYKFKSTSYDSIPTDGDILNTIDKGLAGSSMPNFSLIPTPQKKAMVAYIKSLSPRFKIEKPMSALMSLPQIPADFGSKESVEKGKALFISTGCVGCHGYGDSKEGPGIVLEDVWTNKVKPRDFKHEVFRKDSNDEIFMEIYHGMGGTPMMNFGESIQNKQDIWHIVSYVKSLSKEKSK